MDRFDQFFSAEALRYDAECGRLAKLSRRKAKELRRPGVVIAPTWGESLAVILGSLFQQQPAQPIPLRHRR